MTLLVTRRLNFIYTSQPGQIAAGAISERLNKSLHHHSGKVFTLIFVGLKLAAIGFAPDKNGQVESLGNHFACGDILFIPTCSTLCGNYED